MAIDEKQPVSTTDLSFLFSEFGKEKMTITLEVHAFTAHPIIALLLSLFKVIIHMNEIFI